MIYLLGLQMKCQISKNDNKFMYVIENWRKYHISVLLHDSNLFLKDPRNDVIETSKNV